MSEQRLIADASIELASGRTMPILGLGTWHAGGRSAVGAVLRALEVGYRHIDTATAYGNEEQVGQAVAESGVPREEIFVTTKLPPGRAGRERATLEDSLDALGFGYVDLWLIHWPPSGLARPDVWERLLELQAEGLAREAGVSNYSVRQLDELDQATGRLPAVNQIEWSPALFDPSVLEAHRRRGVQLEGYSPLKTMNPLDPQLVRIADNDGVTPAQVVLRWHIEHRIVAIPKSTSAERIAENAAIFSFELTPSEVGTSTGSSRQGRDDVRDEESRFRQERRPICVPSRRVRGIVTLSPRWVWIGMTGESTQPHATSHNRRTVTCTQPAAIRGDQLRQRSYAGASAPKDIYRSTDHYDRVMADGKRAGFIAGGPRRARKEGEGLWTFLRDWIASLFRVDRRM